MMLIIADTRNEDFSGKSIKELGQAVLAKYPIARSESIQNLIKKDKPKVALCAKRAPKSCQKAEPPFFLLRLIIP